MNSRIINFSAGPAMLPDSVREKIGQGWLNGMQQGRTIAEISHRSCEFIDLVEACEIRLRRLLEISDQQQVLFMQGGATTQFTLVPMNFGQGGYIVNGHWGRKAFTIAQQVNPNTVLLGDMLEEGYVKPIPELKSSRLTDQIRYLHFISNETIHGIQWPSLQDWLLSAGIPLVMDASSDIGSRQFDYQSLALMYAGAQKNLGIAGLTIVVAQQELLEQCRSDLPVMLQYKKFVQHDSMYNTPSTFAWYVTDLVLQWIDEQGGVRSIEQQNQAKAKRLYTHIDHSGFYENSVHPKWRSNMNVTFRCNNAELDSLFVQEAEREGMSGLKGHRAIGGIRASIYNAMPLSSVAILESFMQEFERRYG